MLAGWLMGLLSWLVAAGRDTISQIVLVWLIADGDRLTPTCTTWSSGTVEVLAGVFAGQGVDAADYGHFLLWTTLGNVVGGSFFVALIKYSHADPRRNGAGELPRPFSRGKEDRIMAEATEAPYGRKTQKAPAVKEVHILWITAGLSCDGDSVSVTAATQPSIEDIVMGAIPGLPKVHLHNPVLAYEVGDEFMKYWYQADEDRLGAPFVLVVEGSIPNEEIKSEGYWAALGTDKKTGQPITTCEWIDRLAPKALAVVAAGTCATYGGIHAMAGNPTGAHGPGRLPRLELAIEGRPADRQRARLPGAAGQHDGDAALPALPGGGPGADDPAGRAAAADLAVRQDRPRGLRPRPATTSRATSPTSTARPSAW